MLVHHADAALESGARAVDHDFAAVDEDLAALWTMQAIQDVHEGSLARTVLAENGMHRALPDMQTHLVVGPEVAERLGHAVNDKVMAGHETLGIGFDGTALRQTVGPPVPGGP